MAINGSLQNVLQLPVFLEETNLESGAEEILRLVRPQWIKRTSALKSKIFTDGITNKLIGYFLAEKPREVLILKIYGPKTEDLIDRQAELETMNFLHGLGMGPALHAVFQNGIVYDFIPGATLDMKSCKSPDIYPLVAAETARLHSIPLNDQNPLAGSQKDQAVVWDKIETFIKYGDEILSTNPSIRERYRSLGVEEGWGVRAMEELRGLIQSQGMPLVLCHNDLLLANIIYDAESSSVSFIDYEYCGPNYAPFDVADHFAEFGGVDQPDFRNCPDQEFMSTWIHVYLLHYQGPREFTQPQFEFWVRLCMPLVHLFWILWTVVQSQNSTIDFDYIRYASFRVPEYEKWIRVVREDCSASESKKLAQDKE